MWKNQDKFCWIKRKNLKLMVVKKQKVHKSVL